jgi:hypothetical protein
MRYPTLAPPCRIDRVRVTNAGGGAAAGNVLQRFRFANSGRATCLVRGYPTITALAPGGRRVRLHPRRSGTFFGALVPADMTPGHHVYLDLGSQDVTCNVTHPVVYRDLTFGLPGGSTLPSHARLTRFCGGWEMSRFGLPPRTTATIPPRPGSLDTLRASLHAPTALRAGTTLHYLVTLTNPTDTPVRLAPCPSYTEAIVSRQSVRSQAFFLNCDTVHVIAPGRHFGYRMRLPILRMPRGWAKLAWHLDTPREPATATVIAIYDPQSVAGSTARICAASQLRLAYGPEISPATGQNPRAVRLTNLGHACRLRGYPTVALADANGELLPFQVADSGDQMVTNAPPGPFTIPSRGDAWIGLDKYRCDVGDHRLVSTLDVQVPGGSGTAMLSGPASDDWGYCGAGDPGSTIDVSPFEPTLARAFSHG